MSIPVSDPLPKPASQQRVGLLLLACLIPMAIGVGLVAAGHILAGYLLGVSAAFIVIAISTFKIRQLRAAHDETLRQFDEWTARHGG